MKGKLTALLLAHGWERCNDEPRWVGECTTASGCSKAGRWTHRWVSGMYCAQHAGRAHANRIWSDGKAHY